jgi:transposase-like protein
MGADLDDQVEASRNRPPDQTGPFTCVAADALTMKVREAGRAINAVKPIAIGRGWSGPERPVTE